MSEDRLLRIETKLDGLDGKISDLTRVEERQSHLMAQNNRILDALARHDERLRVLEQKAARAEPQLSLWQKTVAYVITGAAGAGALVALLRQSWVAGGS